MNYCPITSAPCGDNRYSEAGLRLLSTELKFLKDLEYTAEEQRIEAFNRASKMSIQGIQPKLSAKLNIKERKFDIVDKGGKYILKPQHALYPEMPENEDLTMKLAAGIGFEIPLHGLLWSKDKTLTYFIKRFDRKGQNEKATGTHDRRYLVQSRSILRQVFEDLIPARRKVSAVQLED